MIAEYTAREKRMIIAWALSSGAFGFMLWSARLRPPSDGMLSPLLQLIGSLFLLGSTFVCGGGRR